MLCEKYESSRQNAFFKQMYNIHINNAAFKMGRNLVEYPAFKENSQNIHPITPRGREIKRHVLKSNCSGLCLTKEKSFDPGLFT